MHSGGPWNGSCWSQKISPVHNLHCSENQGVVAELKSHTNDSVLHAKVSSMRGQRNLSYTQGFVEGTTDRKGEQHLNCWQSSVCKHPSHLARSNSKGPGRSIGLPWGIVLNRKHPLVRGELTGKITVFDEDGQVVQAVIREKFSRRPNGVLVDKSDNIYVSDLDNSSLFKFNKEGKLVKVIERQDSQLHGRVQLTSFGEFGQSLPIYFGSVYKLHSGLYSGLVDWTMDWDLDQVLDRCRAPFPTPNQSSKLQQRFCCSLWILT